MSRRLSAAVFLIAVCAPALAQIPTANANSYELDNGIESFAIFTATTALTPGNEVAGDGIVNGSPNNQMFWQILPKELLNAGNGSNPGTMEIVAFEFDIFSSSLGMTPGGPPLVIWDMSLHPVTYVNPISGAGPDGRRYPDLSAQPLVTFLGGPIFLPPQTICPNPQYLGISLSFTFATAIPGSGLEVPADGVQELAWCFWQPSGMVAASGSTGCTVGGNLSMMSAFSTNERVPDGITTGAATPAPTGVNRNPFHGFRTSPTNVNNTASSQAFSATLGFREPVLQFRFLSTTTLPNSMTGPERGSGAIFMNATAPGVVVNPSTRTCASGHAGETVIHVVTSDPVAYPMLPAPGIPFTPTAFLRLSLADPLVFALTPAWDGVLVPNTTDYGSTLKHTYDAPLNVSFTGPIPPPGLPFLLQAFIVNFAGGPPFPMVSTNAIRGTIF